ncbi:MAG: hypothetical protein EHM20_04545 [Alphaproteobacteria bacterium]|nr:MAG: hypothetical protein EHM20_04545 [Alphaproteobacteria bacterium]
MVDLTLFDNPKENIFVFKKWNWDYLEAEKFQLECMDYVHKNPHISILIICSHPHCFTLGRGLQKIKETTKIELIDFDPATTPPYPLHQIKRGGGLTFHYPGQFVFYPIINLTAHKKAVYDLMLKIMDITKSLLEKQFGLNGLEIRRDLLGLWFQNEFSEAKIASIGLAVSRFNTYHGLALNFFSDKEMFEALGLLHPCGLPGDIYRDIELLLCKGLSNLDRETFTKEFLESFYDYLIIDKHKSSSLISDSIS